MGKRAWPADNLYDKTIQQLSCHLSNSTIVVRNLKLLHQISTNQKNKEEILRSIYLM